MDELPNVPGDSVVLYGRLIRIPTVQQASSCPGCAALRELLGELALLPVIRLELDYGRPFPEELT